MMYKTLGLLLCGFVFSASSIADEQCKEPALFFDKNIPNIDSLRFEDADKWLPKASDFKLLYYATMSNVCGERWALITVKNCRLAQVR